MKIKFILVETSNSGNIGSSARAINVMGFNNLVVVRPKCNYNDDHAVALSSNACSILNSIEVHSSLAQALSDSSINIALSARMREHMPPLIKCNQLSNILKNAPKNINIIFGNEQSGLNNDDIMLCSHILKINTASEYTSLNLAQAVQIMAYELRKIIDEIQENSNIKEDIIQHSNLANCGHIQSMHNKILQALQVVEFYNPLQPKKLPYKLQNIWNKANLTTTEANILSGIASYILNFKNKL